MCHGVWWVWLAHSESESHPPIAKLWTLWCTCGTLWIIVHPFLWIFSHKVMLTKPKGEPQIVGNCIPPNLLPSWTSRPFAFRFLPGEMSEGHESLENTNAPCPRSYRQGVLSIFWSQDWKQVKKQSNKACTKKNVIYLYCTCTMLVSLLLFLAGISKIFLSSITGICDACPGAKTAFCSFA